MSHPDTPEVLRRARELLAEPSSWLQHAEHGRTEPDGPMRYSLSGAVFHVAYAMGGLAGDKLNRYWQSLRALTVDGELAGMCREWNDQPKRTHAEVIEMLDRAIGRLG